MGMTFSTLFLFFMAYAVLGWACEVTYCSVAAKKLVNRGFLRGPYCPIYGVGAMLTLLVLMPLNLHPALVFLFSTLLFTALEYVTSWLMEILFGMRWWDYSSKKFNLRGRVCLKNSLIFGALGLVLVYVVHPVVNEWIAAIPSVVARVCALLLCSAFILDLIYTMSDMFHVSEKLKKAQADIDRLKELNKDTGWYVPHDVSGSVARLRAVCEEGNVPDGAQILAAIDKLESWFHADKRGNWLLGSVQNRGHGKLREAIVLARDSKEKAPREKRAGLREFFHMSPKASGAAVPAQGGVAVAEVAAPAAPVREHVKSFAGGMNFYKLFWVFVIASVVGYVLETLFCLATKGHIESRQGLIYGPFSQVYGLGAVLMMVALQPVAKKSDRWIFFAAALVGGAFEWVCSFVQEMAFGTVSWEYSDQAVNFGGRTSLLYMLFWGVLGVFLIRALFPLLTRLIEKIPNKQGIVLSWILLVVLLADAALSCAAVYRWEKRDRDMPPQSVVDRLLDENYPDDVMQEIYPNMTMLHAQDAPS